MIKAGGRSRAATLSARAAGTWSVHWFEVSKNPSPDAALGDGTGRSATHATMPPRDNWKLAFGRWQFNLRCEHPGRTEMARPDRRLHRRGGTDQKTLRAHHALLRLRSDGRQSARRQSGAAAGAAPVSIARPSSDCRRGRRDRSHRRSQRQDRRAPVADPGNSRPQHRQCESATGEAARF